jgi:hypothetical protein
LTVTAEVAFPPEERTTLVGFKLKDRPGAGTEGDKFKVPLKPPRLVRSTFSEPEDPCERPMLLPV